MDRNKLADKYYNLNTETLNIEDIKFYFQSCIKILELLKNEISDCADINSTHVISERQKICVNNCFDEMENIYENIQDKIHQAILELIDVIDDYSSKDTISIEESKIIIKMCNYLMDKISSYIEEYDKNGCINNIGGEDDELLYDALEKIVESEVASTSFLQRKLMIGYNRACKIIAQLEQKKFISAKNKSNPREIYITAQEFNKLKNKS